MDRFNRRTFIGMAGVGLLSGCTVPSVTRKGDPFEGGIGGTGIVGLLTEFGSLRVNGLRVETTDRTVFQTPFEIVSEEAIRRGMALTIVARRTGNGMEARNVQISWPVIGTVTGASGRFRVNGVPVRVEQGAPGRMTPGVRVAVSGAWTPDGLVASRIDQADQPDDVIAGVAERTGPTGLTVGGAPVRFSRGATPSAGSFVTVKGRMGAEGFEARTLAEGRFGDGAETLRQLSIEGYLEPVDTAPGYRVAGLGHSFARNLRLAPLANRRAIYFGPYDGRFRARAGYVLPEGVAARTDLLRGGFTKYEGPVVQTI
ncbi:MAG: DUF5666 domain-containing protein [Pseudomonadota bacterium]